MRLEGYMSLQYMAMPVADQELKQHTVDAIRRIAGIEYA
jgi:hypothetical protein